MRDPIRAITVTRVAGLVLFVSLLVFAMGASRQQARVQRDEALVGEVENRTRELRRLTEAWPTHSTSEAGTWGHLVQRYLSAVPEGDTRLGFAAELASIARTQAVGPVVITDRTDVDALGPGGVFDVEDDAVNLGSVGDHLAMLDPDAVVAVDVEMRFRASYAQLLGVLADLAELERVVEMRELEIERDAPILVVSMTVRTYGRVS